MPANNHCEPPRRPSARCPSQAYDMHAVVTSIVDDAAFFEIQPDHARNILVGFARMGGATVGVVANQPAVLAGCLDIDASVKVRAS